MKLLIINPNTSDAMTEDIRKTVMRIKLPDTQVKIQGLDFGPESLESFYDYALSGFGICRLLHNSVEKYDGVLIACYGDPGLYAAKEICSCPVYGIAEASIAQSLLLGSKFAVLAASNKAVPMMENMVLQYGMKERFAGVYPLNISVLEAEKDKQRTIEALIKVGKSAVENGAEVLILGCAGMTGMAQLVEKNLGVTVLDPVEISFAALETTVRLGISSSHAGMYHAPAPKRIENEQLLYIEGWEKECGHS